MNEYNEQNTEINVNFEWHSLVKDIVKNLWAIILAGCIVWMGFYVYEYGIYTPQYTSSALLVVRSKVGTTGSLSDLTTNSNMAGVFAEVFKQPAMKRLAAENLGLASFDGTVSASVQGGTNIMKLDVTTSDPEMAYRLLSSILEIYPNISDIVFTNAVIDVLSKPQVPTSSNGTFFSHRRGQLMVLAMLVEAGGIVVLSLLRSTVKNEKTFNERVDSNLIGTIAHEKSSLSLKERLNRTKRALLINDAYTSLHFSEDYQKIANKLEYAHNRGSNKVFTITSVAENEGKSTAAVNIALALTARGYKVALLDLDIRKPSIYKIFDFKNDIQVEFSDVLSGKIPLKDFEFYRYRNSNLLLALNKTSRTDSLNWLSGNLTNTCIASIREQMDFVIIDSPPISVSADAVNLTSIADRTLLIVRTDMIAAADVNDVILTISGAGGNLLGCILNDVYKSFTMFGQMGVDESEYYNYKYMNRYSDGGYSKLVWEDTFDWDVSEKQQDAETMSKTGVEN